MCPAKAELQNAGCLCCVILRLVLKTMRVLIVEDEHKTAALLSAKLTKEGGEVTNAQDGEAGLKAAFGGGLAV